MELTAKIVHRKLPEFQEIKQLMKRAFPKNEQMPMPLLQLRALSKNVAFLAYYDDGRFCGFSYTVENKNIVFVLYLAVNDKVRSRGYGTAIINRLKADFQGKPISLNIESLDVQAENYNQRVRRINFYKKNGFVSTDQYVLDKNERYLILCTEKVFPLEDYQNVLKKLSFGFYTPKITPRFNFEEKSAPKSEREPPSTLKD